MYYSVNMDHNGIAAHLARRACKGSNAVDGTDEGTFWNENEEDVSVEKIKANDCEVGNSNTDCYR